MSIASSIKIAKAAAAPHFVTAAVALIKAGSKPYFCSCCC